MTTFSVNKNSLMKYPIVCSFFFLLLSMELITSRAYLFTSYFFLIIATAFLFFSCKVKPQEVIALFFSVILLFVFKLANHYLANNTASIGLYILLVASGAISYLIVKHDPGVKILKGIYYCSFASLSLVFLALLSGVDPNDIWVSSRNKTSLIYVTLGAVFLTLPLSLDEFKFKSFFYWGIFFISILSMGRSGIISSFILLAAYYFFYLKIKVSISGFLIVLSIIAIVFLTFGFFLYYFNAIDQLYYLRSKGLEDTARSLMAKEFLKNYDVGVFFFGINVSDLPYTKMYDGNPHNGYIYIHSNFGFVGVVVFFFIIKSLFRNLLSNNIYSFLAILALMLRIGTDMATGIVFFPIVFIAINEAFRKRSLHSSLLNKV